jgi:predicted  nucleic acid-binding Zn-ribbon protein
LILAAIGHFVLPPAALTQESARALGSKAIDGNAVLNSRGLTRVGNVYLLKAEIDAQAAIKDGEDKLRLLEAQGETLRQTIKDDQERLSSMDRDLRQQQQQRGQLNLQKRRLRDQSFASQDANTQTSLDNKIQQIDNQATTNQESINRLNQSIPLAQSQLRNEQSRLRDLETTYRLEKASDDQRFGSLKAQYQPLHNDPEVLAALKQLNRSARPWVMIGPQREYDNHVKSLAQIVLNDVGLEATQTLVSRGVGHRATRFWVRKVSLAKQEKEIRAAGYQARVLESKLTGPDGAANRKKMSAAVAQLKKGLAEVQKAYTELQKDPLVTSAIENVGQGTILEPSDDFKNYARRLPELEKALNTRK